MDKHKLQGEFILKKKEDVPREEQKAPKQEKEKEPIKAEYNHEHEQQTPHFYSSYCEYPIGFKFENQEYDEEILLILRRDFITNVPWIIWSAVLAFIPLFLPFIFDYYGFNISQTALIITILFSYLMLSGFILLRFILWYFNIGIITNKRVRDIDINGVLYKHISEARLDFIQDFSYSQAGVIRSVFKYGDIFIQTAGSQPNIEFDRVPNPADVVDLIGELLGKQKAR